MHILMMIHRLEDASPYCFFVHEQARALTALGHQVTVISPVAIPPMVKKRRPDWARIVQETPARQDLDGVHIEYPRCLSLGDAGERFIGGMNYARAALPVARRLHRDAPFDLIHAHMIDRDGHAGMILADRLHLPLTITAHGTDVLRYFVPGQEPHPRNVKIVRRADALMAVSGMLMDRLTPYRPQDRLSAIVPNGVDFSLVKDCPPIPFRILSVGTLIKRKCMDRTIAAFASLAGRFPEATLHLVGVGQEEAALRAQIASLNLGNRIQLIAGIPHEQLMQEMAEADLFVLPSWGEGFGIVYIEAMASGCITIGSENEGISDVLRQGETGFLVPAGDTAATAAAMEYAMTHPEEMTSLRQRAKDRARTFTWERNARETEAIYRQMLTRS